MGTVCAWPAAALPVFDDLLPHGALPGRVDAPAAWGDTTTRRLAPAGGAASPSTHGRRATRDAMGIGQTATVGLRVGSRLRSAQLMLLDVDSRGCLWFLCPSRLLADSHPLSALPVTLNFSNPEDQVHLAIAGMARQRHDARRIDGLARQAPASPTPEPMTALCVEPDAIDYWDGRVDGGLSHAAVSARLPSHRHGAAGGLAGQRPQRVVRASDTLA